MNRTRLRLAFVLTLAGLACSPSTRADYITYTTSLVSGLTAGPGGGYSLNLMNSASPISVGSGSGAITTAVETTNLGTNTFGGDIHPVLQVTVTDVTVNTSGVITIDEGTLGEITSAGGSMYNVILTNTAAYDSMSPTTINFGDGASISFTSTNFPSIAGTLAAGPGPSSSLVLNFTSTPALVPEPSSLVLAVFGLIGTGTMAARAVRGRRAG